MTTTTNPPEIAHATTAWVDGERSPVFVITRPKVDASGAPTGETETYTDAEGNPATRPALERTPYTMPAKPNVGMALAYLKMARVEGGESSMSWLLEQALGSDGYDALAAEPDTDPQVFADIVSRIVKRSLGGLDAPKAP